MPVNESIWEHMKIFFTATLIWGAVDLYLLKKNSITFENFSFQLFFTAFIAIPIYLIIYLPIRNVLGESMALSISLMFIVYVICQAISYKLLTMDNLCFINKLTIPFILIVYGIFIYLTYHPLHNYLFYDKTQAKYGINEYK